MKLVLGLGVTGFSIASFLQQQKIAFKAADSRKNPPLLSGFLSEFPTVDLTLGGWEKSILQGVDEIFISPGIAQSEAIVVWALEQGIDVVSDIELFSRYAQAPIIGITGSNGKSTVTQLLGEMISASGQKVAVGGNIGIPALECLDDEVAFYVLELSSYQLDYSNNLDLLTGVVLNITPDHLDRYDSFDNYVSSKLSLYKYCHQLIINIDEPLVPQSTSAIHFGVNMPKNEQDFGTVTCHGSCYFLKGDDVLMGVDEMQLIGEHNVVNILAAFALGDQIGIDINTMIDCVKNFKGLEHRLEWVTEQQGIVFYNDSKATNSFASITALNSLISKHENIVLIAGGIAKEESYAEFFELIDRDVFGVVLIGQSAMDFDRSIHTAKTLHAQDMDEAVSLAKDMINNGVVLLSPGCASFDMFDNFEHRGREFKQAIAG